MYLHDVRGTMGVPHRGKQSRLLNTCISNDYITLHVYNTSSVGSCSPIYKALVSTIALQV